MHRADYEVYYCAFDEGAFDNKFDLASTEISSDYVTSYCGTNIPKIASLQNPQSSDDSSSDGSTEESQLHIVPEDYKKIILRSPKYSFLDKTPQNQNKTKFSGLDPNFSNAYLNCFLQGLYYITAVRTTLQKHRNVTNESDLAEELSNLFRMKDLSTRGTIQAKNFFCIFRKLPQANGMGLVQDPTDPVQIDSTFDRSLSQLIQDCNMIILQQLQTDLSVACNYDRKSFTPFTSRFFETYERDDRNAIEKIFGTKMLFHTHFMNGKVEEKQTASLFFTLQYPSLCRWHQPPMRISFADIIARSMQSMGRSKYWDSSTLTYQVTEQLGSPISLPEVLALNCGLTSEKERQFWEIQTKIAQTWVPHTVKIVILKSGELMVSNYGTEDEKYMKHDDILEGYVYDLHMTICHIIDPKCGDNLVAHINVGKKYHQLKEGVTYDQWYLFNDSKVRPIDARQAVDFDLRWKVPAVIYYVRRGLDERYDFNVPLPVDDSIFSKIESVSMRTPERIPFYPLMPNELSSMTGMLVAIDSELVALSNEETEINADGTEYVTKSRQMAVARVTVVRGDGEFEGFPFIDDHISTEEKVVDHLTKFSGINPGDLDPRFSTKYLSTLKLTFAKLSLLIEKKCIFVGHGLENDFKCINIVVPQSQIRDTVYLYHLSGRRLVSLKFLAWYVLGLKIQEDFHDSNEDACTSLALYKRYLELTDNETQVAKFHFSYLYDMYICGKILGWKVPK